MYLENQSYNFYIAYGYFFEELLFLKVFKQTDLISEWCWARRWVLQRFQYIFEGLFCTLLNHYQHLIFVWIEAQCGKTVSF